MTAVPRSRGGRWIQRWNPDDEAFWALQGRRIARRNLICSIFAESLGFSVWLVWSVVAVRLPDAGFDFSTNQLFTLVAVPALVGATARFPYTFAVPKFGGRNWTVFSAAVLVVPCLALAALVTSPDAPYWAFLVAAGLAGLGGGNFASSMANISFFYPEGRKGLPLGLNAAGGNLGVSVVQLVVPALVLLPLIGGPQGEGGLYLQNAGLIWIPLALAAAVCAWLFMDNLATARSTFADQAVIVRRRHTWVMSWLYLGTFGSFIGYAAALPLLASLRFPDSGAAQLVFLGPLIGSLARPVGGLLADRLGGARVTLWVFVVMTAAVLELVVAMNRGLYAGFLGAFAFLFVATGIGNGSTFRMIPSIFRVQNLQRAGDDAEAQEVAAAVARRESAAVLGFTGAIGAYGGFLIPQSYGIATQVTGSPQAALMAFAGFYVSCIALTWWYYLRRRFATAALPSLAGANV
ncbi:MAG: NarK family nitrate/nitrite MFS transporter [Egibacteraceae bacterium]